MLCCFPLRTHTAVLSMWWSASIPCQGPLPKCQVRAQPWSKPLGKSGFCFCCIGTHLSSCSMWHSSLHFLSFPVLRYGGGISWPLWGSRSVFPPSPPLPCPPRCSEEAGHWLCMCHDASTSFKLTSVPPQCCSSAPAKTSEERRLALLGFELGSQKKLFPWLFDSTCCLNCWLPQY